MQAHLTGFALANAEDGQIFYSKNADQLFVPASNTKLFTFYTAWVNLPDSIPALRYQVSGDSLIFWGTGDPSTRQARLNATKAMDFLRNSSKNLYFAAGRYTGNVYGEGWSWDDYNDYYQPEITELPIMDNMLSLKAEQGQLTSSPPSLSAGICTDPDFKPEEFVIRRAWKSNEFRVPQMALPENYTQQIPYQTSTALTHELLEKEIRKPVRVIGKIMPQSAATVYQSSKEEVLREMMLPSDNFIAEHLLLLCSDRFQTDLNGKDAIARALKQELSGLPDLPKWVDGSGLSRMNLFSPRDMIKVLHLIDSAVADRKLLFSLLPAGGKSGTLRTAYPATDQPFVFGKTGTLSGVHNQSGFVQTKKGKTFLFSFMNNNFRGPATDVRSEMVKLLTHIHEYY